jgi:hypothetical protein
VHGFIWSSNLGWISLNCADISACGSSAYWVTFTPNTNQQAGVFSGYAWSPYVGWISFNPADTAVCGSRAILDFSTNAASGFAKALSFNECIALSGSSPSFGVNYAPSSGALSGFAWGGKYLGWIGFTNATLSTSTNIINNQSDLTFYASPTQVASGSASTLYWSVQNISSCTASGDWSRTFSASDLTAGLHSYVVPNITANKSFTMSCVNNSNTTVTATATVSLLPVSCKVIPEKAVIVAPATGTVSASVKFGAQWTNATGFPSIDLTASAPSISTFGTAASVSGNPVTALTDPSTVAVTSTSRVTTSHVITIDGTASNPALSCTPAALYIVPPGKCKDPFASNIGDDLPCKYGVGTTPNTKRPPWEEF